MISLVNGAHTEALPSGYTWLDEFGKDSAAKVQVVKWLLPQNGASSVLIQESTRSGGQTVTLSSDEGPGQMPRSQLDTLQAWADAMPSPTLTLEFTGRGNLTVKFSHADGPAIEAHPVLWREPPEADDPYWVTLRFLRV
jgi:hypothetical protein